MNTTPVYKCGNKGLEMKWLPQGLQLLGGQVAMKTSVTHLFNVFLSYKYYPHGNGAFVIVPL